MMDSSVNLLWIMQSELLKVSDCIAHGATFIARQLPLRSNVHKSGQPARFF